MCWKRHEEGVERIEWYHFFSAFFGWQVIEILTGIVFGIGQMPDPESEIIEEQVGDGCEKLSTDCDLRERNLYDRVTGIKWSS